jgi:energy-coupling factor transporter transmembrane protein EcfT
MQTPVTHKIPSLPASAFHPAAVIALWLFLAIALQALHPLSLLLISAAVCASALALCAARFLTLLRRTRWILLSLLLIYGYITPGTALWSAASTLSPTNEGLLDGALQLARLIGALGGLAVVLTLLDRHKLMSGIYTLAWPLQHLGLSRERFAVRLALTLHYAESALLDASSGWRENIAHLIAPAEVTPGEVELHAPPLTLRDLLLVALGASLLAWVLL